MKKSNKGFTLIELLVVVAIIGILAAVGTPIFQGFIEDSKSTIAKVNNATMCDTIRYSQFRCNFNPYQTLAGTTSGLNCSDSIHNQVVQYIEHSKVLFVNPYDQNEKGCRYGGFRPTKTIGSANDPIGTCRIGWENAPNVRSRYVIQCVTKIGAGASTSNPDIIVDSVDWWRP